MPGRDHLIPKRTVNRNGVPTTVWVRPETERASYGATPFKGVGRTGVDVSLSDPYYESERYGRFMDTLHRRADEFDVDIESSERALGIWEGTNEPSSSVSVTGTRDDIEEVARRLGQEFDQQAIRVIYQPGNGKHKMYSFPVGSRNPQVVMETLHEAGVPGARVTEGQIELADPADLGDRTLSVLERFYGPATVSPCEVVRVFTSGGNPQGAE